MYKYTLPHIGPNIGFKKLSHPRLYNKHTEYNRKYSNCVLYSIVDVYCSCVMCVIALLVMSIDDGSCHCYE